VAIAAALKIARTVPPMAIRIRILGASYWRLRTASPDPLKPKRAPGAEKLHA
jgi:hypothetical protein